MQDIDFKSMIRTPKQVGNEVWVIDGNGKLVEKYSATNLTEEWLQMSNDGFYKLYGFNWIPPLDLQDKVKAYLLRRKIV